MKNLFSIKVRRRTLFLGIVFIFWFAALAVRLAQLQVVAHPRLKELVTRQNQNQVDIEPKRGCVYDRDHTILARDVPCKSLALYTFEGDSPQNKERRYRLLKTIPGLDLNDRVILRMIREGKFFIYLDRKVETGTAERVQKKIEEHKLAGVLLEDASMRRYPQNGLFSPLLGRIGMDKQGQSGVELRYESVLGGEMGKRVHLRDARRRLYDFKLIKRPRPGQDIHLTLDETIQYFTHRRLSRAMKELNAAWASAIVSHPRAGDILALVDLPSSDLNDRRADYSLWGKNRAIQNSFDPGSTFKIVTFAAALESGLFGPHDSFDCSQGYRQLGAKRVWDHKKLGILNFSEVFIHSSNVGTSLIADRLGKKRLHRMIQAFRFGNKTGVDLPGEELGIYHPLERWHKYSHNYLSYGYEINVTAMQLLQAVNIVANRGIRVPLHIVTNTSLAWADDSADQYRPHRVLAEDTALRLTELMRRVVEEGTGVEARIPGYSAAGKTGTAQKIDLETKTYRRDAHIATFVGFVPAENPVISMVIVIDDPQGKFYGGEVAAPIFRDIAQDVMAYLYRLRKRDDLRPLLMGGEGGPRP